MPVKKTGMPFEVYSGPNKDENGQNLLYARPARGRRMTLAELENFSSESYAMRNGELSRAFQVFISAAARFMSQGYSIETPIGVFEPKLTMKRPVADPDDVQHNDVEFDGIQIRTSKMLHKAVDDKLSFDGFRYVRKPLSARLLKNEEHLLKALQKSISDNGGYTTASSFAAHSGLTVYSAKKRLDKWCRGEEPLLRKTTYGRSTIFMKA